MSPGGEKITIINLFAKSGLKCIRKLPQLSYEVYCINRQIPDLMRCSEKRHCKQHGQRGKWITQSNIEVQQDTHYIALAELIEEISYVACLTILENQGTR